MGVLHRLFADLSGLTLIDVGDAAEERALEITQRVAAHPLDVQVALDVARQQVGQLAGAGELDVAVGVGLDAFGQLGGDGLARAVVDALGHGDHAAAQAVMDFLDVGNKGVEIESALRRIDEVRAVVVVLAPKRRGGGEEAGVAAHDDADVNPRQGPVVQVYPGKGAGDEARRGRIPRRVVVDHQVVVDGLGDMDAAQRVVGLARLVVDDTQHVRRIVAADIEESPDPMGLKDAEDLLAVFEVGLVAGRAEGRRGRVTDQFQVVGGLLGQVEELLVDDAAHPVKGAVNQLDAGELSRFQHRADHGLIDHRRRPAALGDQNLTLQHGTAPFPSIRTPATGRPQGGILWPRRAPANPQIQRPGGGRG